jgi:hypothetical protein
VTTYKVKDPTGAIIEVEGPEGATDEQIIQLAQKQPAPKPSSTVAEEAVTPKGTGFLENLKPDWGEASEATEKLGYRLGGKVTDATGSPAAGYATNVAAQAGATLLGTLGGSAAQPAAQGAGKWLMGNALKPSVKANETGKAARAIDTMLKEGISVSEGGIAKLKSHIDELGKEVAAHIASNPGTVNKNAVLQELQLLANKVERRMANPQESIKAIETAWNRFVQHPLLSGTNVVPVGLAQEMKQGTQAIAKNAYGEMKGAEMESQKALARGLRKEIERVVPEVAKLNAKESDLINAKLLAEVRLFGEKNQNPGGSALLFANNNPAQALGWMAARSSFLKSLLARGLYKGAPTAGAAAGGSFGAEMGQE